MGANNSGGEIVAQIDQPMEPLRSSPPLDRGLTLEEHLSAEQRMMHLL